MIGWTVWPIVLLLLSSACASPAWFSVPEADVTLRIRPDGAIDISERVAVRFDGPAGRRFERRIPLERAESLSFESATFDGRSVEPGRPGDTSLEVDAGGRLRVVWTFPPESSATHVFELRYRANGAVAIRGSRGTIRHVAVRPNRAYSVERATVRLAVHPGVHLFDGAGIAEAGWTVARVADGLAAERSELAASEGATVMAEISIDPALISEPAWQRYQEWGADLVPAFISGGLFILVIGGGVLWIIRFQYPRRRMSSPLLTDHEERERRAVRRGLRATGFVAIALAAVLALVTWLTLIHFGWWPMALPVSILIVGFIFLAVAKRIV